MRRLLAIVTLSLAGALAAAPVLAAAETIHFRGSGNFAGATFSNVPSDQDPLPAGTYFYTDVFAADSVSGPAGDTFGEGACVFHETFTIDANGERQYGDSFSMCLNLAQGTVEGADFAVSKRLADASLVAAEPIEGCAEYDPVTEECIDVVILGTIMIDLDWTGVGPISRYHGTSSGGTAGNYQYSYHGTGSSRAATPGGTVALVAPDGSVTDLTGGLAGNGSISRSRDGSVEVIITRGG